MKATILFKLKRGKVIVFKPYPLRSLSLTLAKKWHVSKELADGLHRRTNNNNKINFEIQFSTFN